MADTRKAILILPRQEHIAARLERGIADRFPEVSLTMCETVGEAQGIAADAEILLSFFASEPLLAAAPRLRWIQALGAGVDGFTRCPSLRPEVILTNAAGLHATSVSEAVLAGMFALARDLPQAVRSQAARTWGRWMPRLLDGATVAVVGTGAIGRRIAQSCGHLGMHVLGVSATPRDEPDFARVHGLDDVAAALAVADYVVLAGALTDRTAGLVDKRFLAAMKPDACLLNVGRGAVVVDDDLVEALRAGTIAGACLDVFIVEPLPADHPYWTLPNVIVTPHRAGYRPDYAERVLEVIVANMSAFLRGDVAAMVNPIGR